MILPLLISVSLYTKDGDREPVLDSYAKNSESLGVSQDCRRSSEHWTASTLMIPLPRTFPPTPHRAVRRATVWSGRHELCIAESLKIRPTTNRYETERVKGSSFGFVLYSLRFEQFYCSECEKPAAYVTVTFTPISTLSVSIEVPICTPPSETIL